MPAKSNLCMGMHAHVPTISGGLMMRQPAEHWSDWLSMLEDSHILNHWHLHHGCVVEPKFRFDVVRYCKDALSRQAGKSTRISNQHERQLAK